jgi:hypothetical protein
MLISPAAFVFESGSPVFVIASKADKMASRSLQTASTDSSILFWKGFAAASNFQLLQISPSDVDSFLGYQ